MKLLRDVVVLTIVVVGLLFARTVRDVQRVDDKNTKVKSKHYWVQDYTEYNQKQLDRKRTHKRRRKIKKPVKGLR